jgi:hypothetical protein
VELPNVRKVNTLLSRLAKMAKEAKARGEDAPYVRSSVPETNLILWQPLRTKEFPNGIPHIKMPQFQRGSRSRGTPADDLRPT